LWYLNIIKVPQNKFWFTKYVGNKKYRFSKMFFVDYTTRPKWSPFKKNIIIRAYIYNVHFEKENDSVQNLVNAMLIAGV